jgi:hypothetical protein
VVYPTIEREQQEEYRSANQNRNILADQLLDDEERAEQGAKPQQEQNVEDVAAHDVANGQRRLSAQAGLKADRKFGGTRAEGYHRQSNHERRETDSGSQTRSAPHQQFTS